MNEASAICEHMEVIGADGVHVGTVDRIEGDRIKLTRADSGALVDGAQGQHEGHHRFISTGMVASVEGDKVRLSTTAANAQNFTQEEPGSEGRTPVTGQDIDEDEMIRTAGVGAGGDGAQMQIAPDGQDNRSGEQLGFGEEAGQ